MTVPLQRTLGEIIGRIHGCVKFDFGAMLLTLVVSAVGMKRLGK